MEIWLTQVRSDCLVTNLYECAKLCQTLNLKNTYIRKVLVQNFYKVEID